MTTPVPVPYIINFGLGVKSPLFLVHIANPFHKKLLLTANIMTLTVNSNFSLCKTDTCPVYTEVIRNEQE